MRTVLMVLGSLLLILQPGSAQSKQQLAVRLLDGYTAKQEFGMDVRAWTIEGKNGLRIHFESGPSEGRAADAQNKNEYQWFREQTIDGRKVYLALAKRGAALYADLDRERKLPQGDILMVTFPLGPSRGWAANFVAKVANKEEMMEMLLMALTFDPSNGSY